MTLQWHIHDDGYMWAYGRRGRYEVSDAGRGLAWIKFPSGSTSFTEFDSAKMIVERYENDAE